MIPASMMEEVMSIFLSGSTDPDFLPALEKELYDILDRWWEALEILTALLIEEGMPTDAETFTV